MSPFGRCGQSVTVAGVIYTCGLDDHHRGDHIEYGQHVESGKLIEWRLSWAMT